MRNRHMLSHNLCNLRLYFKATPHAADPERVFGPFERGIIKECVELDTRWVLFRLGAIDVFQV